MLFQRVKGAINQELKLHLKMKSFGIIHIPKWNYFPRCNMVLSTYSFFCFKCCCTEERNTPICLENENYFESNLHIKQGNCDITFYMFNLKGTILGTNFHFIIVFVLRKLKYVCSFYRIKNCIFSWYYNSQ